MGRFIRSFCVISLALIVQGLKVSTESEPLGDVPESHRIKLAAAEKITKGLDELRALYGSPAYKKTDYPDTNTLLDQANIQLEQGDYSSALSLAKTIVMRVLHDDLITELLRCKDGLEWMDADIANFRINASMSRVHDIMRGCERLDLDTTSRARMEAAFEKVNEGLDALEGGIVKMKLPSAEDPKMDRLDCESDGFDCESVLRDMAVDRLSKHNFGQAIKMIGNLRKDYGVKAAENAACKRTGEDWHDRLQDQVIQMEFSRAEAAMSEGCPLKPDTQQELNEIFKEAGLKEVE